MAFAIVVVVSFSALLLQPASGAPNSPSTASYGVEDSLRALKTEWESVFNSKYEAYSINGLQFSINDPSCGNLLSDSLPGCQEIVLQSEGRAFLASAGDQSKDLVRM